MRATSLGRGLALGALVGVTWGVLARVFMRLISTEPGFSWAGTMIIVGLGVGFFSLVGLVAAARSQRRSRWWRLAALPGLILFAGQGLVFLPGAAVVATGLALRTTWQRAAVVAAGLGGTYWLLTLLDDEQYLQPRTQSLGFLVATVCTAMLGVGLHRWLARWPAREVVAEPAPSPAAYAR